MSHMARMRFRAFAVGTVLLAGLSSSVMAVDLDKLWDFHDPSLSEQRFRSALSGATPDEKIILQTQIARTYGLRRDFARAREILQSIRADQVGASPEARARYHLELGRTHASAAHPEASRTAESREIARHNYLEAFAIAERARLDNLAIDALHMMPFVDTDPAHQLRWNERALDYVRRSAQPGAKKWEGSLRNNIGYALHLNGDYDAALREFRLSRSAFEAAGRTKEVRIADWMIAWTLRAQKKFAEALAMQLALERALEAAGERDPYVFEELELLYRALGNDSEAARYAEKRKS